MTRYTEDTIVSQKGTEKHPGPWIEKQRVYQTKANEGKDWFDVRSHVVDANGEKLDAPVESGLSGTREWLGLEQDEPILKVKRLK